MRAAVHDHPAAGRRRRRRRLHLAPHRRGDAARRPRHRVPRRPARADQRRWPRSTRTGIIAAMVGREPARRAARATRQLSGETVLSVSRPDAVEAAPRAAGAQVLRGVSFDLAAGEILGIGGLLGSGRTEILETIFGSANGQRRRRDPARRRARRHPLAARRAPARPRAGHRGPQDARACISRASITDNVALPLVGRLARFGLRSFAGEAALARDAVERARHPLRQHRPGRRHAVGRQPAEGGDRQMAGDQAARAAARRADARHRCRRQARDLRPDLPAGARRGLAIVVVSSELPELLLLADRILVMSEGRQTRHARARRRQRGAHHAACRAAPAPGEGRGMSVLRLISRTKLYWGLIAIFLIGVLGSPVSSKGNNIFLSYGNLLDVLRQVSITGLIATGMTAVIITGGIDLSVGSLMAICTVVCAMLLTVPGDTPAVADGPADGRRWWRCSSASADRALRLRQYREGARRRIGRRATCSLDAFARPRSCRSPSAPCSPRCCSGSCCRRSQTKFGVLGRAAGRALRRPAASARSTASSSSAGGCSPSS